MNKKEIEEIEKYFVMYTEGVTEYRIGFICKKYFHNGEDFNIAISNNGEVYQLNSDGESQGVELETLEDFKIRFKSFTAEEFDRDVYKIKYDDNMNIIYR